MILYIKIDTQTGSKQIGQIQMSDFSDFKIIIPDKSEITNPENGQMAKDDDYIYVYLTDKWKRISIANP
jgi:hypothetical protein